MSGLMLMSMSCNQIEEQTLFRHRRTLLLLLEQDLEFLGIQQPMIVIEIELIKNRMWDELVARRQVNEPGPVRMVWCELVVRPIKAQVFARNGIKAGRPNEVVDIRIRIDLKSLAIIITITLVQIEAIHRWMTMYVVGAFHRDTQTSISRRDKTATGNSTIVRRRREHDEWLWVVRHTVVRRFVVRTVCIQEWLFVIMDQQVIARVVHR